MSRADKITAHRLGSAKIYLKKIKNYTRYSGSYEDYETTEDSYQTLKSLAERALLEMEKIK